MSVYLKPFLYFLIFCTLIVFLVVAMQVLHQDREPTPSSPTPPNERIWHNSSSTVSQNPKDISQIPVRSLLNIESPLSHGDFVWDDDRIRNGHISILVDLKRQLISVFRGGHEIGTAVILYGADSKPTPNGTFRVLEKAKDYRSKTYDAPMPYMLRLTSDGVAIHGSAVRKGFATHGCIGVPLAFARHLFHVISVGDEVFISNAF